MDRIESKSWVEVENGTNVKDVLNKVNNVNQDSVDFGFYSTVVAVYLVIFSCVFVTLCVTKKYLERGVIKDNTPSLPIRTMIVLGSGGHTQEMLTVVKSLEKADYAPRIYVMAHSDKFSKEKVMQFETERGARRKSYIFERVNRIREVDEDLMTTLRGLPTSIYHCSRVVNNHRPQLILCNGPGICVPICYSAWFLRCLGLLKSHTIYVESICRVKTLSLSGKFVLRFVDYFFVQWMELEELYKGVTYVGRLS